MFPNIKKSLRVLLTTATSALVERANFALRFTKTDYISDNSLEVMFPNLKKSVRILLATATSMSVERANCALHLRHPDYRSTMSEDRFNSFVFLYVHWGT